VTRFYVFINQLVTVRYIEIFAIIAKYLEDMGNIFYSLLYTLRKCVRKYRGIIRITKFLPNILFCWGSCYAK
jgi:hypothetical protein